MPSVHPRNHGRFRWRPVHWRQCDGIDSLRGPLLQRQLHSFCPERGLPKTPSHRHLDRESPSEQVDRNSPSPELSLRRLLWVLRTISVPIEMAWLPAVRMAAWLKTAPRCKARQPAIALRGCPIRLYSLALTACASPCPWY